MTLSRNIMANYVSQIYVTSIGIVMVPVYINLMGVEAYGLIGFYAMMQAWFSLLDLGLTPTVARETARFKGGDLEAVDYRALVKALEGVFLALALIGSLALLGISQWFGGQWITADTLTSQEIVLSLQLMAGVVGLRWLGGLYRGIITGAERLILLSFFNIGTATLRFVLIVPVLLYVNSSPLTFFRFQIFIAFIELFGLILIAYRQLPAMPTAQRIKVQLKSIMPVFKFSLSVFFTSLVWITVTQSDKLMLSKILSLLEYGYFSVAVVAASGIMVMTAPVTSAILPRMARIAAEGNHDQLIGVYKSATKTVSVIVIPIAALLGFFPDKFLWSWTGNSILVTETATILTLYALGYGLLSISSLPYSLQYASGNLKLHLMGSGLFVAVLLPMLFIGAQTWGTEGAGWAWVTTNLLYFIFWVPILHRRFAPGIHLAWLTRYVAAPALTVVCCAAFMSELMPDTESRILTVVQLGVLALLVVGSSIGTNKLLSMWFEPKHA